MSPVLLTFGSVLIVSLVPLLGLLLFLLRDDILKRSLLLFVSFSTGGLLGDVFLHMIPEMGEEPEKFPRAFPILLGGILFSFVVEKLIHWRHCHTLPHDAQVHGHHHPVGTLSLIGDVIHNAIDGLIIAGAFLAGTGVGISTALAVLFHEVPQEIGDSAVLLHSGFRRSRVIVLNLLTALSAIAAAAFVLFGRQSLALESSLLPFAAGNFLYIAGADLIPELHRETGIVHSLLQLLFILAGIGVMAALTFLE